MKPVVLLDPVPRTRNEIFSVDAQRQLAQNFTVIERGDTNADVFYTEHLPQAMFIVGQPALSSKQIHSAGKLRAILNVEGNFLQNMDYTACFEAGVHVLAISPVFAQPVAELALGLTLALARDIPAAHQAFVAGDEQYGLAGNQQATLLAGATVGFVGFGDLGHAIHRVLAGFHCQYQIYDPWLSPIALSRAGLKSSSLDTVLANSDVIYVVATVTPDSTAMLGVEEFRKMQAGTLLILLSRADVVDFPAMLDACNRGHIRAATDVFTEEPVAADDPLRTTKNLLLSAHRAGALYSALLEIGERVLADLDIIARGLPPQNCKRAERELVGQLLSKPVQKS